MRSDRVWESRQSLYRCALQRHGASHWEGFVALCGQIDRIAKGRADGDPWQVLDRLLAAIAEPRANRRLPSTYRACPRSETHNSQIQSLMRHTYSVICLKNKQQ